MKNNQKNNQLCSVNSLFYIWMYIIMLILFGNKTNYKVIFSLTLLSLFLFVVLNSNSIQYCQSEN